MNVEDPYRAPRTITEPAASHRRRDGLSLAAVVWLADSVLLLLAFYYLRPVFADFDVALPVLSQWLIQPWRWAIVMMVAIGVCALSFSTQNPTKRRLAGVIALVVGLVALAAVLFGVLHPLISLIGALS